MSDGIHSMPTRPIMPGGGVAKRPLHVILLADCSGSMTGAPIQALNFAIVGMLQHFAEWEQEQDKKIMVRAIAFASDPARHIEEPVPVSEIRWSLLSAVPGGHTNMAPAFRMLARVLSGGHGSRGLRPVLVLITDGLPTDPDDEFDEALKELLAVPAARDALRIAIAIGDYAKSDSLTKFIGNSNLPVLVAGDEHQIADQLYRASLWVTNPNLRSADFGRDARSTPIIDDVVV